MRNTLQIVVTAILLVAFIVLCFFAKCPLDYYFLVAGFIVLVIGSIVSVVQENKIRNKAK